MRYCKYIGTYFALNKIEIRNSVYKLDKEETNGSKAVIV